MLRCAKLLVRNDFDGDINKICEDVGIKTSTFYGWYKNAEFKEHLTKLINNYIESELVNMWKAVVDSAKNGNLQALKLLFDFKNLQSQKAEKSESVIFISGEDKIEE